MRQSRISRVPDHNGGDARGWRRGIDHALWLAGSWCAARRPQQRPWGVSSCLWTRARSPRTPVADAPHRGRTGRVRTQLRWMLIQAGPPRSSDRGCPSRATLVCTSAGAGASGHCYLLGQPRAELSGLMRIAQSHAFRGHAESVWREPPGPGHQLANDNLTSGQRDS